MATIGERMTASLDASGLNKLAVDLTRSAGQVGAATAVALRKSAADIQRDAQMFCPVDTGNLRASISTSIIGDGRFAAIAAEIGPTADYGIYVELGTSTQAPAAFMGPAFDRNAHLFEDALLNLAADGI